MDKHPSEILGVELGPMDRARRNKLVLFGFLIITLGIGALSSVLTEPSVHDWYLTIRRPSFDPPGWVFPIVWTALYAAMAYAAFRVWRVVGFRSTAIALYAVQLAFNFAWSFLFFTLHRLDLALIEIGVLWLLILATTIVFVRRDRSAGVLFAAYLGWVSFAAALNYAIWQLN